jgi:protein-disulfide isomerase
VIHRDFVMDATALAGVTLARCSHRYEAFIKVLFEKQDYWAFKKDFKEPLMQIGRLGGVDPAAFEKCLEDQAMKERIIAGTLKGREQYDMQGIPAIIVDGVLFSGKLSALDDFIERAYERKIGKK